MDCRTLHKAERVRLKREMDLLFHKGKTLRTYPVRTVWTDIPCNGMPARMMVSVPKRLFKRAVDRNLIKRRIRSAYRLHKAELTVPEGFTRLLAFVYVSRHMSAYADIEAAVINGITSTGE